jgi:hypothetical protein
MSCRCCSNGSSVAFRHSLAQFQAPKMERFGYGSLPIDTFLVGWTSIYHLFWCSLGARVLTHPHFMRFREISATKRWEESQPEKCRQRTTWTNGGDLYAIKIGNFRAVYPCLSDNNVAQWIGLTETVPFEIVNFVGRWSLTFYNYFIIVGLPVNPSVITLTTRWPQARWYHLHRLGRCSSRSICNGRVPAGNVLAHPHFLVSSWLELPRTGNLWKPMEIIGSHWKPILILIQHPWPIYDKRFEHETNPPRLV